MIAEERIHKVYELIKRKPRRIEEIADILNIKRRTVSGYLNILRKRGLIISSLLLEDSRIKIHHTSDRRPVWRFGHEIKQEA